MPQKYNNPSQKPRKKGHKPAHQNTFAFRHNPKSKLTAKILSSPNTGLCQKCHDKIEWRKQYRKYKPLTQPSTCFLCNKRNVLAAYHNICDACATSKEAYHHMIMKDDTDKDDKSDKNIDTHDSNSVSASDFENSNHKAVCAMCVKSYAIDDDTKADNSIDNQIQIKVAKMEEKLKRPLKLRESKAIERKVIRDFEKEKERAKEERRRLRLEQEGKLDDDNAENDENDESHNDESDNDEDSQDESDNDHCENYEDESDDPFLQAIGGKGKLLTGEAYQQMLLEKEKQRLANLQISNT